MTAVTPNEPEVEAALGVTIGHDPERLEAAGRTLLRRLGAKAVLITRGSDGMALFEPGRPPSTSRSTAPTRWRTSRAPATP